MKILITEKQFSRTIEKFFAKKIEEIVLPKYPWAVKVETCEFEEQEDEEMSAYILIEIDRTRRYKNNWGRYDKGIYSKEYGGNLLYGMEIESHNDNVYPFLLTNEIRDLAESLGLSPHESLFSIFFINKANK